MTCGRENGASWAGLSGGLRLGLLKAWVGGSLVMAMGAGLDCRGVSTMTLRGG